MRGYLGIIVLLLISIFIFPISPTSAEQEKRIALVIGNGAYRHSPLPNPPNDANDIAAALRQTGFRVNKKINATRTQMREAVREFADQIKRGGVGLFFFAGHGLQVEGENFLVPVDADIKRKYDVRDQCLAAGYVLEAMEDAGNRLNIIILDACRDNPFRGFRSRSRGLAHMNAPTGSLLAYATSPGSTASDGPGRNGLYTSMLLNHMLTPDMRILDLFINVRKDVSAASDGRQVPWETHSLTAPFYMTPRSAASAPPAAVPAAAPATAPLTAAPAPSSTGSVAWLGVEIRDADRALADQYGLKSTSGAFVQATSPNGPAARAGIRAGDMIQVFDNKKISKSNDLPPIVAGSKPGSRVKVVAIRSKRPLVFNVTLGELTAQEIEQRKKAAAEKRAAAQQKPDAQKTFESFFETQPGKRSSSAMCFIGASSEQ